ncbi:M20 family metallopeptidase [Sphaerobacter thermophilus]|uniref:M20 family metallopeptidase n=1 Tax=Sphaerobacter thermophilus TaxID=2057 RepID=UPI000DB7C250|nr:MAG: peptidase M20 [Sphaerobacter thermophilus]
MVDEQWLRAASDTEEAVTLTSQLVAIRSYPGEEGAVQRAVAEWLRENGLEPELMPTEGDRPNVVARVENGEGPTLLLNGHVDTVLAAAGWSSDPWRARREGDRLYGLGAGDMKAGVAAAMLITRALAQRRDLWQGTVIFTSVVDEEAYSIGARALIDAGIRADACIVTEPSWDHPTLGGVGKVLVRGDVIGRASHGSLPEEGINAAVEAARLIARLDEMPLGQHPKMKSSQSVLSLHSGSEQYVITVPERARFTINRHIVPGETNESVLAEMRALADSLNSPATFEFAIDPPYYPPWEQPVDHPLVERFSRAYAAELGKEPEFGYFPGVSDANYFSADAGIPTIQFGPRAVGLHQRDEWVDIPTIGGTIRVILRLALDLLQ